MINLMLNLPIVGLWALFLEGNDVCCVRGAFSVGDACYVMLTTSGGVKELWKLDELSDAAVFFDTQEQAQEFADAGGGDDE